MYIHKHLQGARVASLLLLPFVRPSLLQVDVVCTSSSSSLLSHRAWPFISMFYSTLWGFPGWRPHQHSLSTDLALLIFDSLLRGFTSWKNFSTNMLKEQLFGDWKNMSVVISICCWEELPPCFSHGRWLIILPCIHWTLATSKLKSWVTSSALAQLWQFGHGNTGVSGGGWGAERSLCSTFLIPFLKSREVN